MDDLDVAAHVAAGSDDLGHPGGAGPGPPHRISPRVDSGNRRHTAKSDRSAPIRILIVDDHSMVRSGLRLLLEEQDDFDVVGEAGDVDAALERTRVPSPT